MVIVFALLAAFCNAVNEATQHIASTASPRRSSGWQLVLYLFRNPLWLFGWVALIGAFLFQALALHNGLISVVQPLMATELVFMLVLRQFWIHQSIRLITWGAAALTCVSLAVFILASEPRGGQPNAVSHHWFTAILACCAATALLAILARWGSPGLRAALYASAAAVMWALVATFIKATTDTLTEFGVAGMFTRWPVYALVVGSAAATVLQQAALHVGPLRVSQPFLVIVDPIVSIALSVWLYNEHFTSDAAVLALGAIAFAVMCGALILLTQTTPATMKADTPKAGPTLKPAGLSGPSNRSRASPGWRALTLTSTPPRIHLDPNDLGGGRAVPAQQGFFGPRSARGSAALLPEPPWHYSGDLLTVEYRVNPERVRELLPEPLELAKDDPGAVAFIWADWQSCAADKAQLLDPVLGQYKEAFIVVRCSYRGETFSRCVYIWVDSDFAIARGLHQGYPKKLGSIHMTRPHPYGPAPRVAPGGQFGASLAAADRRLAEARITLLQESPANGFVNAHPMAHNRFVRSIENPSEFRLDEIIATSSARAEGGPAFRARVDRFQLFAAPTEELDRLAPEEIISGYYRQVGVVWNGGRLLHDNLAVPGTVPAEVTEHV